jgi:hypothetical protein
LQMLTEFLFAIQMKRCIRVNRILSLYWSYIQCQLTSPCFIFLLSWATAKKCKPPTGHLFSQFKLLIMNCSTLFSYEFVLPLMPFLPNAIWNSKSKANKLLFYYRSSTVHFLSLWIWADPGNDSGTLQSSSSGCMFKCFVFKFQICYSSIM